MMKEPKGERSEGSPLSEEAESYGEPGIVSLDARIPTFLLVAYVLLPIWGVVALYYFWNRSAGWLDRGHWHELQIAANTTFPISNSNYPVQDTDFSFTEEDEASPGR